MCKFGVLIAPLFFEVIMIYLIYGETGEYADSTEWDYGYIKSEQKAQEMTQFLNSKLLELGLQGKYKADLWEKQRENRLS